MRQWSVALPSYLPHYSPGQQMLGTAILAAIGIVVLVVIVIRYRRGR